MSKKCLKQQGEPHWRFLYQIIYVFKASDIRFPEVFSRRASETEVLWAQEQNAEPPAVSPFRHLDDYVLEFDKSDGETSSRLSPWKGCVPQTLDFDDVCSLSVQDLSPP